MPYQLILSTDTLDQGRIKINDFFQTSSQGLITGGTGTYSIISVGNNNFAGGNRSFAHGYNNSAITGNYSTITNGDNNYTTGAFNFIGTGINLQSNLNSKYTFIGNGKNNTSGVGFVSDHGTIVNGLNNTILGTTTSNGKFNTVLNGNLNKTKGPYSTVLGGASNYAKSRFGIILNGKNNTIKKNNYTSTGTAYDTILNGRYNYISGTTNLHRQNFIFGQFIESFNKNNQIIFGDGTVSVPLYGNNNKEFILGQSGIRQVRIRFEGSPSTQAYLASGAWQTSGADYGEYFEWKDKNVNKDVRTGFFVEIEAGLVKIAKSENVIGIVSKTTAFIGDSSQDYWSEMYLKDEWGATIYENYDCYEFDDKQSDDSNEKIIIYFDSKNKSFSELPSVGNLNGLEISNYSKSEGVFVEKKQNPKFNPSYDPNFKYIPRKDRPEWDVIGLLGKLRVRTSEQITGNYVDVDTNTGMAKNGTKYPIMKKIKDFDGNYGVVEIFFK